MTASIPVDDRRPPWPSFAAFFTVGEGDAAYLTELTAANLLVDCDAPSREVPGGVPPDSRQVSTS